MPADPPHPLTLGTHANWDRMVAEANPASMLLAIRSKMGDRIRQHLDAEDAWQETLLMAWRDRESVQWRGPGSFRRWLLQVADNRIRDLAAHAVAGIRGKLVAFSDMRSPSSDSSGSCYAGPWQTTSPGLAEADR